MTHTPAATLVPAGARAAALRGFTLLELLVVLLLVAIASGVMTLALRDGEASRLETEAVRLATLLEMARAESRVGGQAVSWQVAAVPGLLGDDQAPDFRFVGLGQRTALPERWLARADLQARVLPREAPAGGAATSGPDPARVWLGPDAVLPPQAVELRLGRHRARVASDGLGPFTAQTVTRIDTPVPR